jgi:hypothetical protein
MNVVVCKPNTRLLFYLKGKKLEDFISQEGLCIFNDGTDTYLHPGNGSYSAIDLAVTDPSLLLDFR